MMFLDDLLTIFYQNKKGKRTYKSILIEMLGRNDKDPYFITPELAEKVVLDPYDIEKFLWLSYLLDTKGTLGYQDKAKEIVKALEQTEKLDLGLRREIKERLDTYEDYLIETYVIKGGSLWEDLNLWIYFMH